MIIVVDASVAVKWFVKEEGHSLALGLLDAGLSLTAPDLIYAEAANVLWKKLKQDEVTVEQAEAACEALPEFLAAVAPTGTLIREALRFARRLKHPVYDCIYLALAQYQAVKLITADRRFAETLRRNSLSHLVLPLDEADALNR